MREYTLSLGVVGGDRASERLGESKGSDHGDSSLSGGVNTHHEALVHLLSLTCLFMVLF